MERSKPLHNFSMPCLRWGNQKLLRCMNVNSNGEAPVPSGDLKSGMDRRFIVQRRESEYDRRGSIDRKKESSKVWPASNSPPQVRMEVESSIRKLRIGDNGIEAFREKLMFDLHTKADKMKDAILREGLEKEEEEEGEITPLPPPAKSPTPSPAETDGAARPWNLRTRRAACKAPMNGVNGGGSGGGNGDGGRSLNVEVSRKPNFSPLRNESKSPKSRGGAEPSGEKRERAKFSVQLSRSEMEEDFLAMTGQRLPRRPKKRPKIVQKQLEGVFPGMWLTEVNADLYRVDAPETGKK